MEIRSAKNSAGFSCSGHLYLMVILNMSARFEEMIKPLTNSQLQQDKSFEHKTTRIINSI
ncbi:hypothetical protein Mapa_009688 [Marchantia paleacea]|nr:hypothetical protein Mapa_009688 [Marchantia paleacea]